MKGKKFFKFNNLYFIIMIFIIIAFYVYLNYQYNILKAYSASIEELNNQIEEQNSLQEELTKQNEYKNSDEYIEKLAREKLGMVKSDEIVFYNSNK